MNHTVCVQRNPPNICAPQQSIYYKSMDVQYLSLLNEKDLSWAWPSFIKAKADLHACHRSYFSMNEQPSADGIWHTTLSFVKPTLMSQSIKYSLAPHHAVTTILQESKHTCGGSVAPQLRKIVAEIRGKAWSTGRWGDRRCCAALWGEALQSQRNKKKNKRGRCSLDQPVSSGHI